MFKRYSMEWYANFNNMRQAYDNAVASDEARLANELQAQFSNITRTHALTEAKRLIGNYGIGVSLVQ